MPKVKTIFRSTLLLLCAPSPEAMHDLNVSVTSGTALCSEQKRNKLPTEHISLWVLRQGPDHLPDKLSTLSDNGLSLVTNIPDKEISGIMNVPSASVSTLGSGDDQMLALEDLSL